MNISSSFSPSFRISVYGLKPSFYLMLLVYCMKENKPFSVILSTLSTSKILNANFCNDSSVSFANLLMNFAYSYTCIRDAKEELF